MISQAATPWSRTGTLRFLEALRDESGGYASVPGGARTLYGTCYALLTTSYLDPSFVPEESDLDFVRSCQDAETGFFAGPELAPSTGQRRGFDRERVLLHLACTALPTLLHFGATPDHPLRFAEAFLDKRRFTSWLARWPLTDPWSEGNDLLFAAQLLIDARDRLSDKRADSSLEAWFRWHLERQDALSGLWDARTPTRLDEAVYGGYHQLLAFFHERNRALDWTTIARSVLSLQHWDGGFRQDGGGGACEDVDALCILVNLLEQGLIPRYPAVLAIEKALHFLRSQQNGDGGFSYRRDEAQCHLGIRLTQAPANTSTAFATWFRVHALALVARVLPEAADFDGCCPGFTKSFSMGWHPPWQERIAPQQPAGLFQRSFFDAQRFARALRGSLRHRFRLLARGRRSDVRPA